MSTIFEKKRKNKKFGRNAVKAKKLIAVLLCFMMLGPVSYAEEGLPDDDSYMELEGIESQARESEAEAPSQETAGEYDLESGTEIVTGEDIEGPEYEAGIGMGEEEVSEGMAAARKKAEGKRKYPKRPIYRLGVGDKINIIVRHHPEFSGEVMVEPDGMITIPLTGDTVRAEGLTKRELAQGITEVISYYVEMPRVAVTISSFESKFYYVVGMVGRPGRYPLGNRDIHVKDAIIQAGLTIRGASTKKVHVITPSKEGNPTYVIANLDDILYKGDLTTDVVIKPGQIVVVPSTFFTKWNQKLQELLAPITSIAAASYIYRTFRELPPFSKAEEFA